MSCLRYLYLFTYDTLCFVVFCFSSMLPVSPECPFVIALSVFSDVYFDIKSVRNISYDFLSKE